MAPGCMPRAYLPGCRSAQLLLLAGISPSLSSVSECVPFKQLDTSYACCPPLMSERLACFSVLHCCVGLSRRP